VPHKSDDFVWLPVTNNLSFGEQMLAGDWATGGGPSTDHAEALLTLRNIYDLRQTIWGKPSDDPPVEQSIAGELPAYSKAYFLATLVYYICSAVQFLLTVQINPVYTVDGFLRVGSCERQARLYARIIGCALARYNDLWPQQEEHSSVVKYARHILPVLERMSNADIFNPINKECLQLERLRELAGGTVSLYGNEKGWVVKSPQGKIISKNVDGGLAVLEAVSALQYGTV
jgi:hypothetical protein